jgi:endonuclease G
MEMRNKLLLAGVFCLAMLILSVTNLSVCDDVDLSPASVNQAIQRDHYILDYNEEYEQSNWVFYKITEGHIKGTAKRKNHYKSDPMIPTYSSNYRDYTGTGYDRGHLCPAGSMKINQDAMDDTFYMSNISPQNPGFNRGIWNRLEQQVRRWVDVYGDLYVVTGPVFDSEMASIGENNVSVPKRFYKVVYACEGEGKMIGFVLPNEKSDQDLTDYTVSVDEVERITNIDFYFNLDDRLEDGLESNLGDFKFN